MRFQKNDSQARRVRARNRLLLVIFLVTLAVTTTTNPSPDGLRPVLFATMVTLCAKLVIEFALGLPMSFLTRAQLQPVERPARIRVVMGALGMAVFTLYVFYAEAGSA